MKRVLESDELRLVVMPERGGKLASLIAKRGGGELLFQPPKGVYPPLTQGMRFADGDASGFDDVFPSMGEPGQYDHGAIWTTHMHERPMAGGVQLACEHGGFHYEKSIRLIDNEVLLSWRIANMQCKRLCFVWVCHCLWRWSDDMRLFCAEGHPPAINLRNNLEPISPLCTTFPRKGGSSKQYINSPVTEGICGFEREGVRVTMHFDPQQLPYLGLWMTNGGYRGDVNFAWEPATGLYDTMARCTQSGTLRTLQPAETARFDMRIVVTQTGAAAKVD